MKHRNRILLGICAIAMAAGTAHAETGAPADQSTRDAAQAAGGNQGGQIEEIIVTAQKRSENQQNVPIAISALTGTQLARSGVTNVTDIKVTIPSLNVTNSAGYLSMSLRGIGSNGIGPGVENPIALYIDGVYYGSPASSLMALNNVERIEVLKGPQGTLFGRNATGGLVQVITKTPGDVTTGDFNISYGNLKTVTGNAYISGPLANNLAMDLAVSATSMGDGFGKSLTTGDDVYKLNHDVAVRSKIVFTPSHATKLTLIGDYSDHRDSYLTNVVAPGTISGFEPAAGPAPSLGWNTNDDLTPKTTVKAGGVSLRWDQEVANLNFMSLTAYREARLGTLFDYDGGAGSVEYIDLVQRDDQFSQELQLSAPKTNGLTWLVGAYYYLAHSDYSPFVITANDALAPDGVTPFPTRVTVRNRQSTESIAGYAQATYEIAADTNITLGGRYTSEKRAAYNGSTQLAIPDGPVFLTIPADDRSKRFNKFTYRVSLDHRFSPEVLGYLSYNRGFKSGGFNVPLPGTDPYRPETLDAYEAGLKMDLFDRTVRFNIAGFYYDYKDVQIQQLNQGTIQIINGAKARDYGVDADLTVQATDTLRLVGGFSWISPKFRSFPQCFVSSPVGGIPSSFGSCAGNQMPLAAKFTGNVGAAYHVNVGSGVLDATTNLYYSSGFYPESDNVIKQGAYELLNASLKYTFPNGLSIGAYGKNLTNSRVINFSSTVPNGTHLVSWQPGRSYGATLGFTF